jgi:hypothetical protein
MDHSCKLFYRQRVESHIVLRNQLTLMNSVGRLVDYGINFFQSRLWGGSEFFLKTLLVIRIYSKMFLEPKAFLYSEPLVDTS